MADRELAAFLRRTALGAVAGAVFVGLQAFWLVPLLTYHGGVGLPIPQAPNFNVLTLGHGLTGVDAFWTGGTPAQLVQAPLNPAYMILPLLALTPVLARRMRPEVLWLVVAALLFAFFAKTDNAPLGGVYDWMYIHVPGWKLFREGSKFLYIVMLAYAILIPIALAGAFEWAAAHLPALRARMLRAGAARCAGRCRCVERVVGGGAADRRARDRRRNQRRNPRPTWRSPGFSLPTRVPGPCSGSVNR